MRFLSFVFLLCLFVAKLSYQHVAQWQVYEVAVVVDFLSLQECLLHDSTQHLTGIRSELVAVVEG